MLRNRVTTAGTLVLVAAGADPDLQRLRCLQRQDHQVTRLDQTQRPQLSGPVGLTAEGLRRVRRVNAGANLLPGQPRKITDLLPAAPCGAVL